MVRTVLSRVRPFAVVAALVVLVLSFGSGAGASADPGGGKAHDHTEGTAAKLVDPTDRGAAKGEDARQGKPGQGQATRHHSKEPTTSSGSSSGTSGDPTSPQPLSNADQNTGGSNGQCPGAPYCSTRDGSASASGHGAGKATGKPCAGCVGKADNKNPRGQKPGPQDDNNGYECDGNSGVAKGNPAHTGCAGNETPPPATDCVPSETKPCADEPPVKEPPVPAPPTEEPPAEQRPVVNPRSEERPVVKAEVLGVEKSRAPVLLAAGEEEPTAVLPETGSPMRLGALGVGGMALVSAGALTLARARRRSS